jgi:hypothetical protein
MDKRARIGTFMATTSSYGNPVGVVKPPDNVTTVDPALAALEEQLRAIRELYDQLAKLRAAKTPV